MTQHIFTDENGTIQLKRKPGRPCKIAPQESLPESTHAATAGAAPSSRYRNRWKNCLLKSSCSTAAGCSDSGKSRAFILLTGRQQRAFRHFDE